MHDKGTDSRLHRMYVRYCRAVGCYRNPSGVGTLSHHVPFQWRASASVIPLRVQRAMTQPYTVRRIGVIHTTFITDHSAEATFSYVFRDRFVGHLVRVSHQDSGSLGEELSCRSRYTLRRNRVRMSIESQIIDRSEHNRGET